MAVGDFALVTLPEVKDYLKIEQTTVIEDALLERLIDDASSLLEQKYKRPLKARTFTNQFIDATGDKVLILRTYPLISVDSLTYDDGSVVEADSFVRSNNDGMLYRSGAWGRTLITYRAGYENVPGWLRMECLELIADLYEGR